MNDFAIGKPQPKQQQISRFSRAGQVILPLVNRSETPARFHLEATDHTRTCYFEFQLPDTEASLVQQAEVRLAAGESVDIAIRIIPPPASWLALGRSHYYYTITARKLAGAYSTRSVLGHLSRPPLIGPWLISLTIVCLLILSIYFAQPTVRQTSLKFSTTGRKPIAVQSDPNQLIFNESQSPFNESLPEDKSALSYEEIFQEIGPQYDLDWRLLAEVAYQESRMDPLAIGKDSDLGLMQIIPSTWREWAPKVGATDPFDPYDNIHVAAAYLAYNRDYTRSRGYTEEYWMLVGYNWGPSNLRQLFDEGGNWNHIPERRRQYALDILQARGLAQDRWQTALTLSNTN